MNVAEVRRFAVENECEWIFDEGVSEELLDLNSEALVSVNRYELTTDEIELVLYYQPVDAAIEPVLFGIIDGALAWELLELLEAPSSDSIVTVEVPDDEDDHDCDGAKIEALYGGAEAMKNLRLLTHVEVATIQRAKVLVYLTWDDASEANRARWTEELAHWDSVIAGETD